MTFRTLKTTLLAGVFAAAAAPAALAQQANPAPATETAMPFAKPDQSWINISGTVMSPTQNTFLLDYGGGQIIVEMDNWNGWVEAMNLGEGHQVTVVGRIDNDILETASIEASAVVDDVSGQHFFASAADEEDLTDWFATQAAASGQTTMRGVVQTINAEEGEFVIDNGVFEVQVDTGKLKENPLEAGGATRIKQGDIVTVSGTVESDLFEARELQAMTVNLLTPDNVQLETSAQLGAQDQQRLAIAGAPPGQGEAWEDGRQEASPKTYAGVNAEIHADQTAQQAQSTETATTASADVMATLPEEVQAASAEEGYTTEDLAKAQLAAIQSAPPLNPS